MWKGKRHFAVNSRPRPLVHLCSHSLSLSLHLSRSHYFVLVQLPVGAVHVSFNLFAISHFNSFRAANYTTWPWQWECPLSPSSILLSLPLSLPTLPLRILFSSPRCLVPLKGPPTSHVPFLWPFHLLKAFSRRRCGCRFKGRKQ